MYKKKTIKGNQINWNQVFYFSQIALHGSIKEAAAKSGLTPSTLSEHLTQLEADLDVQLFSRQHRKLVLTAQGSRLFQHAKQMFEAGQRLIDVVSPVPLGCYPVSVAVASTFSVHEAHLLVSSYLSKFGPVNLKLCAVSPRDLEAGLAEAKYDFGFSYGISERKDLIHETVATSPLRFYVPPKLGNKDFCSLIESLPLLMYRTESRIPALVDEFLADHELVPHSVVTSDSLPFLMGACEKGIGMGLFSEGTVTAAKSKLTTVRLPKSAPALLDKVYVLWSKEGENSEAVKHLKEILSQRHHSIDSQSEVTWKHKNKHQRNRLVEA